MNKLSKLEEQVLDETKDSMDGVLMVATALRHSKTEEEYNAKLKEELNKYKSNKY